MKMLIISDIHGNLDATLKVLKIFNKQKIDYIILLGDVLYHGPRNPLPDSYNPKEVYEALNQYKDKIIAVRGNCDSEVDQMVLDFPIMEDYNFLPLKKRIIYFSHGHIYHPDQLPKGIDISDIFISGHTHIPMAKKINDIYILNPGSLGLPKDNNPQSYGIIDDISFTIYNLQEEKLISLRFD